VNAPADPTQELARALRAAASKAVDVVGGGVALVFASGGEASPNDVRLRAAAGFAVAEDARDAGAALLGHVREALALDEPTSVSDAGGLGERAAAGVRILPLRFRERTHGALVVGLPGASGPVKEEALQEIAESTAIRFDHARLELEFEALRSAASGPTEGDAAQSEEVLRLSEALFAQDIELLRSNEKLGKIERLKNDFIEKMSRELRTPLNGIIEAIISVLTGEDEALSEGSKTALRTALDEGSSFLRTLQNILDLWKIKQGELPIEIQDVNFRELVDEAIFSVQDSIGEKPLRIETDFVEPLPRVRTDLTKLNQILFLLLDNATKFTPEGTIQIQARVEGTQLIVGVRDDGIGICHDDQQFIFDEFYQVDEPSSQKYRGAGLGLTLVRDLVTLLDGEVAITSDIGRGTSVQFSIPVQPA